MRDMIICFLVVLALLAGTAYYYAGLPVVYWSQSRDECVKVWIDGEYRDCSELPEKYERVMAE